MEASKKCVVHRNAVTDGRNLACRTFSDGGRPESPLWLLSFWIAAGAAGMGENFPERDLTCGQLSE
jgi:hypothetical protein